MSDDLRARRLARQIASIGLMDERVKAILDYGNARYLEGYEDAHKEEEEHASAKSSPDSDGMA